MIDNNEGKMSGSTVFVGIHSMSRFGRAISGKKRGIRTQTSAHQSIHATCLTEARKLQECGSKRPMGTGKCALECFAGSALSLPWPPT